MRSICPEHLCTCKIGTIDFAATTPIQLISSSELRKMTSEEIINMLERSNVHINPSNIHFSVGSLKGLGICRNALDIIAKKVGTNPDEDTHQDYY